MKLPNLAVFFALLVVICSAPVVAQHTTSPSPAARSPEIVLKEFYKWYIHELNGPSKNYPWKTTRGRATLKQHVTLSFIRAIDRNEKLPEDAEAFDADYFLLDQDTGGITGKYISVSKVAVKGTTATAIVGFGREAAAVYLSLIQEGGVWKINKVKNETGTGLVK